VRGRGFSYKLLSKWFIRNRDPGYSGNRFVTLLYTDSNADIPAKLVPAGSKRVAGIQNKKTAFRISMRVFAESRYDKPGMIKGVELLTGQYKSLVFNGLCIACRQQL